MTAPNMSTITISPENFSLNNRRRHVSPGGESSSSSDQVVAAATDQARSPTSESSSVSVSIPCHWEQCLDLKTGEIYYINWRNGMTTKEAPKKIQKNGNEGFYYEEEEDTSYDSDKLSCGSSSSPSRNLNPKWVLDREEIVLVVAGCKRCYTYVMVPKHLQGCPRCNSNLIHFYGPQNGCP